MQNKKLYTTRPSMPSYEEYAEQIRRIWDTAWLTNMGEQHNELEKAVAEYLGVEKMSMFVNGHMALEMVLQAFRLEGEVITTPFTFISTTHAIVRNGLTPVFCDIREEDFTIDASKIEELITERTTAIVPVHVYGNVCDIEAIERIADKYGLKVIYDAAHAFGVKYGGKGVGGFGDAAMFSFHATKVFNSIEGGAVVYHDDEVGKTLYNLKNFGIQSEEVIEGVGANAKMNEFQAAMGLCNLRHIDENIAKRRKLSEYYYELLEGCQGIRLQKPQPEVESNYAYMPALFEKSEFGVSRDVVYEQLREADIFARKYFYPLTSEAQCYRGIYDSSNTPVAKKISADVLALPLFADMTKEDIERVCSVIRSAGGLDAK